MEYGDAVRDLNGVQLDKYMTFEEHVRKNIVGQMCSAPCYISRIRYPLTEQATRLLILVLSRWSYCAVVWGDINKTGERRLPTGGEFRCMGYFFVNQKTRTNHTPSSSTEMIECKRQDWPRHALRDSCTRWQGAMYLTLLQTCDVFITKDPCTKKERHQCETIHQVHIVWPTGIEM